MLESRTMEGLDMNNTFTHSAYTQMIVFQSESSKTHLVFNHPSYNEQQILHALAHQCVPRLEYEYYLSAGEARISRSIVQAEEPDLMDFDWNSYLPLDNNDPILDMPELLMTARPNLSPLELSLPGVGWSQHQSLNADQVEPSARPEQLPTDLRRSFTPVSRPCDTIQYFGDGEMPSEMQLPSSSPCGKKPILSPDNIMKASTDEAIERRSYLLWLANTDATPEIQDSPPVPTRLQRTNSSQSRIGSRANSVSSVHSTHGGFRISKIFSRTSSAQSATSMYSCFDSRSAQSGATDSSAISRRARRAMDTVAKAAMKAVKAVGACWKCKLLRKQCDEESPCPACPNVRKKSEWRSIGCRRGTLGSNMDRIIICQSPPDGLPGHDRYEDSEKNDHITPEFFDKIKLELDRERSNIAVDTVSDFLYDIDTTLTNQMNYKVEFAEVLSRVHGVQLWTLDECSHDIVWELSYMADPKPILGGFTITSTMHLLRCSSLYQSKTHGDQLISLSLRCLRDCLQVLRLREAGLLVGISHRDCSTECIVAAIANLETSINHYVCELSNTFFHKDKIRRCVDWWLSVFYSLCIQNFVRQSLLRLMADNNWKNRRSAAENYLYLALRLFTAYSRKYDPLIRTSHKEVGATMTVEDRSFAYEVAIARRAVKSESWKATGIKSSIDYLVMLFDDYGEMRGQNLGEIISTDTMLESAHSNMPQSSQTQNSPDSNGHYPSRTKRASLPMSYVQRWGSRLEK